eukprot:11750126-Karenia_brevis.AAC.1
METHKKHTRKATSQTLFPETGKRVQAIENHKKHTRKNIAFWFQAGEFWDYLGSKLDVKQASARPQAMVDLNPPFAVNTAFG